VTLGNNTDVTQNPRVDAYKTYYDLGGKEMIIAGFGSVLGIVRTDGPLAFRWIGVYSTATDCTGELTWVGDPVGMLITATTTTNS
jgi:hypothetical protein